MPCTAGTEMLLKVMVRHASRASFRVPPIKFKYGQSSPSSEDVPVITTPITPQHKGKQSYSQDGKRKEERSQTKEKSHVTESLRSHSAHVRKGTLSSGNSGANKYNSSFLKKSKNTNRNRFIDKTVNQSVEDNLRLLGINVSGEVIYGIFPVLLALQAKRRKFHHLIYKNGSGLVNENIQNIVNIGEEQGIPITSLKPSQFKKIFPGDQVHQGVCCDVSPLPLVALEEEYLEQKEHGEDNSHQEGEKRHQLWLYLDQIQDPMNYGAVLRSAYFMGVSRVITSETCSTRITSTVSKASAGVAELFPVHQVQDPAKLTSSLTHAGWEVVSSASPGSGDNCTTLTDVTTFSPKGSILLIVGNEGKGISPELKEMCHTVLTIEPGRSLHPHLQCLNVSVATALLLHSLRQRLTASKP